MATCPARRAATAVGCALLLALSTARAADPHPAAKAAPKTTAPAKSSSKGGKPGRSTDVGSRRAIAGGSTADDVAMGVESPELRTLREAERELFPPASPAPGSSWPADAPLVLPGDGVPQVSASGVPPSAPSVPPASETGKDLSWLSRLELPDLPVRWDDRVVRYLEFFRDEPRGRATFSSLYRRSGRWRDMIRRTLRRKSLPEDLVWVAMVESGFEPTARSRAGAAGLWQFMPETGRIYGLSLDRWLDLRLGPPQSTEAAADFLSDLHRRFGSWDLALAGYNMGHAGLTSVVRRYNTNDFWSLARTEGTLPWETTLYVPKIVAVAVVAHNLPAFGFGDLAVDAPVETDEVDVPPGTLLAAVAQAAGCSVKDVQDLNPELRAGRTPPATEGDAPVVSVRVPQGKGAAATQNLAKVRRDQPLLDRYVVRFGETLEQIAAARKTTTQKLVDLNAIAPGEAVRGGTVLLVPKVDAAASSAATDAPAPATTGPKQSVVVPSDVYVYPDRKRVFYRVLAGDTLKDIAGALHVPVDDLRRWNDLDPAARLQEGMTLQAFVRDDSDLAHVVVVPESEVRVLAVGSDEFFASLERDRGFKRVTIAARAGDTIESIGKRFDVSARTMERINRRPRGEALKAGDPVVVYVPSSVAGPGLGATASNMPQPNGPLPVPPVPDLLPAN
jgi:membrane-bound lytic murein transglycosylase D